MRPDLFRKACDFGLEGLVSKRSDRPYRTRYEKARRGELIVAAPVGFVKVGDRLEKGSRSPYPGSRHPRLRQGRRTRQCPASPALVHRA
jgi:hypothetical protein